MHNFIENIEFIKESGKEYILLAPSYMICNIDYKNLIKDHIKNKNDITVVYKDVNDAKENFIDCEVLNINEVNRVISIGENIGKENRANIKVLKVVYIEK